VTSDASTTGPADEPTPPAGGLRAKVTALVDRAKDVTADARRRLPPVDIAFTAAQRDDRIGGFVLAGAIAFRCFVYLLPLYLLGLVAAGAAVSFDPESPSDVAGSAGLSRYVAGVIGDAADTSKKSLWILAPVTLWALFTAGSAVHKVLAAAHANAWEIGPVPKPKSYVASGGVFLFAAAIAAGVIAGRHLHSGVLAPLGAVVAASYYFGVWLVVSRLLPRPPDTPVRALIPGAVLVAVGTQGLYLFNVLYLNQKIESATEAYGALGIAASLLLWLYLLGRLMVAAPVLNATLWQRSQGDGTSAAVGAPPG
jgi:uncharacterized BrkB/YihY/UPF0761 family membrane protein